MSGLIKGYQLFISPWIGPRCRFLPTCSDYALDALARHGAIRGGGLILQRLARCHPFGGSGFDPVPEVSATLSPFRAGGPGLRPSWQPFQRHRRPSSAGTHVLGPRTNV
ncbi:MAG: membrane protein insertion efficiency factor YidD [Geminicoccaceae bacterium]